MCADKPSPAPRRLRNDFQGDRGRRLCRVAPFRRLHSARGSVLLAALVEGAGGMLYGTTSSGGLFGAPLGGVFQVTPGGAFTVLHTFRRR